MSTQADDDVPYGWDVSEVSDAVLRKSQPLPIALVPTEDDFATLQSFKYHAEPGQRIYVHVGTGLKSFGGYVLGKPTAQAFTVPDYPKLLRFMADGSLLSLSGSKRVSGRVAQSARDAVGDRSRAARPAASIWSVSTRALIAIRN